MNREDIIRMAREAGLEKYHLPDSMLEYEFDRCIEHFARAAYAAGAAAEREACAKVCQETGWNSGNWCAKAIRARGNP